ncbi:MAG TPA: cytochrome D1 domain-containing protein [Burkholderiales bacterium]|nr:cytochrome D1 domain-containing protein [Burkholderiales bacterium]
MDIRRGLAGLAAVLVLAACAGREVAPPPAEAGVVIERASGSVQVLDPARRVSVVRVTDLGDLSHAAVVFSSDARYAYVFGRDGGLSKIDMNARATVARTVQAGNSIGGAISRDGRLVAVANYEPGGIKIFDAQTLALLAEVPSAYGADGKRAKVVGIADAPGNRFVFSLFEAGEIWIVDASDPRQPQVTKFRNVGKEPYDALITPDGRWYIAGLFGEDGLVLLDMNDPDAGPRRILDGYGRGTEKLPVYKMPHLRGWALAGGYAFLPAVGRHEVLVVDATTWQPVATIPVRGQPVFVMARPDGRQVWVNFAFPGNDQVQVIDVSKLAVIESLAPGKAVLHMEFTTAGDEVWISARDDNRIVVYDTKTFGRVAELPAQSPSGIFFTWRAQKIGL